MKHAKPNLAALQIERSRIGRQLSELLQCEADIRKSSPLQSAALASAAFRAEALRQYLAQLDHDIDALIEVPLGV